MSDNKQWLPEIREKHVKRGDVHDLLTSHTSKPGAHGLTLPKIGNGRMTTQQTDDIKEVKKLSTCFSASRHGFDRLPMIPAASSNKYSPLNQDRVMPLRLPPIDIKTQSSSSSSCRPKSGDLHRLPCKLPPIFERKEKLKKKHKKKHEMLPDVNGHSAEWPRTDKAKKKKKKKKKETLTSNFSHHIL
ncbi:uncharacterized protein LOC113744087 isoform X2 [Larimichthys crocea]|uniref:uncharacterized protein LOC113744087 isoform X2 n=1 Tax=Larimichthys crocea TaxID=215358 RepID=UPI000F5D60FC|nr:uncharacterized protein LOC113744087 isoform X2 [Larimichthys crocea]